MSLNLSRRPAWPNAGGNRQWASARVAKAAAILVIGLFAAVAALNIGRHQKSQELIQRNGQADVSAPSAVALTPTGDDSATVGSEASAGSGLDSSTPAGPTQTPDGRPDSVASDAGGGGAAERKVDPNTSTGQNVPGSDPTTDDATTAEDLANRLAADLLGQPADADIDPEAFEEVGGSGAMVYP